MMEKSSRQSEGCCLLLQLYCNWRENRGVPKGVLHIDAKKGPALRSHCGIHEAHFKWAFAFPTYAVVGCVTNVT